MVAIVVGENNYSKVLNMVKDQKDEIEAYSYYRRDYAFAYSNGIWLLL